MAGVLPEVEPKEWYGPVGHGQYVLRLTGLPGDSLRHVRDFFQEAIPAVVERPTSASWEVRSTVFHEYVPVGVRATVCRDGDKEEGTAVVFDQHIFRDAVRFGQIVARLAMTLEAWGLLLASKATAPSTLLLEGFGDGFDDGFELDMQRSLAQRVDAVFEAMASRERAVRAEGVQAFAMLAEANPTSRPTLARALTARREVVGCILADRQTSVADLYPLAAALKFIARDETSCQSTGVTTCLALWPRSGLEPLVHEQLQEAEESVRKVQRRHKSAVADGCGEDLGVPSFEAASTRCPTNFTRHTSLCFSEDEATILRKMGL